MLAGAITLLIAQPASAQSDGFRVNRYQALSSTEDGIAVQLPSTLGHLRWSAGLTMDFSRSDLEVSSGAQTADVVGSRLSSHLALGVGLGERFELGLSLPLVLSQSSDVDQLPAMALSAPDSSGVGDPFLGGSVAILGDAHSLVSLGAAAGLRLPIGSEDALAGDDGVGAEGRVLFSAGHRLRFVANVGASYRPDAEFADREIGSEFLFRGGLHTSPVSRVTLMAELDGSTSLRSDLFAERTTAVEGILGARAQITDGWYLAAAAGTSITDAIGAPSLRVLFQLAYTKPQKSPTVAMAVPLAPIDSDEDGIADEVDECPNEAGDRENNGCPAPLDSDGDGVNDEVDQCPKEAETQNGLDDEDGCPDELPTPPAPEPLPLTTNSVDPSQKLPDPIEFEQGEATLLPQSSEAIDRVVAVLAEHSEVSLVEVQGHTSREGSEAVNQDLSQRRAQAVVDALVLKGVARARLKAKGYGYRSPIANDASQVQNRRVQFMILKRSK